MRDHLEFEKPLIELEEKITRLRDISKDNPRILEEIARLEKKAAALQEDIYARISAWQRTQIARHLNRPTALDYIQGICEEFIELHGDRLYGDDPSIVGGLGRIEGRPVVVIGHQKGKTVRERVHRNFGMPHPEGYRKALRLMQLAERFHKPVITLIDTPGAYPGIGAEERGQSEAIARNLLAMSRLKTPIVATVIGEGGSGGALAIGVGDRVLMFEHAIYSVISPEGCAAILWEKADRAEEAAEMLKMTARDLLPLGIIDEILPEPAGGAHRDAAQAAATLKHALHRHLKQLEDLPLDDLVRQRYDRFRKIGMFTEWKEMK